MLEIPADGVFDREEAGRAALLGQHLAGSRPPLYLIRTWHTEIEHERALARMLGPEQPLVSVGPPAGKAVEDFPADAHAWADFALARLDSLPGASLRQLGGWSFGGIVAYEVAQRIARRGDPVERVAILDTRVPLARPLRNLPRIHRSGFHRAVRHLEHFLEERTWPKRRAWLRARWQRRQEKLRNQTQRLRARWRGEDPHGPARGFDSLDGSYVTPAGERITLLQRAIWVSYRKYRPTASTFPLLVLRTAKTHAQGDDAAMGWGPHVHGDFESALVPGDHFTMWEEPHVRVVAEKLAKSLSAAGCGETWRDAAPELRRSSRGT